MNTDVVQRWRASEDAIVDGLVIGESGIRRFLGSISFAKADECWLWTRPVNRGGYGKLQLGGARGHHVFAHRISYELTVGPIPQGAVVMHACDTPACVNPAHLSVGSHRDNAMDTFRKGRFASGDQHGMRLHPERRARGERHGMARLTEEDVVEIREQRARGIPSTRVARQFALSVTYVNEIARGDSWAHVGGPRTLVRRRHARRRRTQEAA